jgi:hypothetical protein
MSNRLRADGTEIPIAERLANRFAADANHNAQNSEPTGGVRRNHKRSYKKIKTYKKRRTYKKPKHYKKRKSYKRNN